MEGTRVVVGGPLPGTSHQAGQESLAADQGRGAFGMESRLLLRPTCFPPVTLTFTVSL